MSPALIRETKIHQLEGMHMQIRSALAVLAVAGLTTLALATPAHATEDTEKVTAGPMTFGPNGFAGVSCPEGTKVVTGGYTWPEGAEHLDVKLSEAMEPETVYPHYTTGPGETGWYVQNGETGQALSVWAECAAEAEPSPSASPSVEPSETSAPSAPPAAGGLPVTGVPVAGLAVGGVVLLGAGAGLLLARRRRVRFTA